MSDDPTTSVLRHALRDVVERLIVLDHPLFDPLIVGGHDFVVEATSQRAHDSGRVRYRVACRTCGTVEHEATTAPALRVVQHLEWAR